MGLLVPFVHGHVESRAIETGKPEIGVAASFHSRRDAIAQIIENVVGNSFFASYLGAPTSRCISR